ncbi:MAG: hypothetical protein QNJ04_05700 [Desulfobacterales bacterium]|nr:hypothetical protein [Desulfobacterales bacterium]
MTTFRFMAAALKWAALHFLACLLIVPATLKAGEAGIGFVVGVLAFLTKVLYFPIMGLALYPRHWFPGQWIYVPIAGNSLVWGLALAAAIMAGRRWHQKRTAPDV